MVEPTAIETGDMPDTGIVPIMEGDLRGDNFIVSLADDATMVFIQFEGWTVGYYMDEMLAQAYAEIQGERINAGEIDL